MTGKIVFDNSVMMPLFFPDEDCTKALEILELANSDNPLLCPALWIYEFCNVLTTGLRRNRIGPNKLEELARLAQRLPIHVVAPPTLSETTFQVSLAHRFGLSFYDASYLALAISENAALATHDKSMQKAARDNNLHLI